MKCHICSGLLESLGSIPFDRNNFNVPIVNTTPMEYFRCSSCSFISCQEMLAWSPEELGTKVYNKEYVKYDPDYAGSRSENYAEFFATNIRPKGIKHLDYGSGEGHLSNMLHSRYRWDSVYYDPYSSPVKPSGAFNLITAIEVFEHSQNIDKTIKDIKQYLTKNGVIIFSTLLATNEHDLSWEYIGARNGHIGIFSEKSIKLVAQRNGLFFSSLNANVHILQSTRNNAKELLGWLM